MIDLHMHTIYSDGTDSIEELLEKAQNAKLNYISITDHNTCAAFNRIKEINIKDFYSGKIITGVELNTKVLGIPIEILGYNFNPTIAQDLINQKYISNKERSFIEVQRLYNKCLSEGINLPKSFLSDFDGSIYASKYLHLYLIKDEKNKSIIDEDAWNNSNIFYRKYMSNPDTIFYINMDDKLPDFEEACEIIRKSGGLVFIPHIYEYRENSEKILEYIMNNYKIDGFECYYTTFSIDQTNHLLTLCKENNLFISGGSDYHGKNKSDVSLGVGKGNLCVPDEIIKNWAL